MTLLDRVKGASGPDRELDIAIMLALGGARRVDEYTFYGPGEAVWTVSEHDDPAYPPPLPRATASLDAALALAERVLPNWSVTLATSEGYRHPIVTMGRSHPTNRIVRAEARTLPLALLAALLSARDEGERDG